MNYISKLKLLNTCKNFQDIIVNIEKLKFVNEMNQSQELHNSDICLEAVFYEEEKECYCNLLFIDNKEKISELIGEDFELEDLELTLINSQNEELPFCIIDLMQETDMSSLRSEEIQNFFYGLNKEQSLFITGQKPDALFGYDLSIREYQVLAREIYDYLEQKIINENISFFITGGKLGIETIAFFSILKLKEKYPNIYNVMTVPYLNMDGKWPKESRERYRRMLKLADKVIEIDTITDFKLKDDKGNFIPEKSFHSQKQFQQQLFISANIGSTISVYKSKKTGSICFNEERPLPFY